MSTESSMRCDECGREQPLDRVRGPRSVWFRVQPLSQNPGVSLGKPTVIGKDFCGEECLVNFIATKWMPSRTGGTDPS